MKNQTELCVCHCWDCRDSESPCHMDCDVDSLCEGCRDAYEGFSEMLFESSMAIGKV
jgi:hypothetical protein